MPFEAKNPVFRKDATNETTRVDAFGDDSRRTETLLRALDEARAAGAWEAVAELARALAVR